MLSSKTRCQLPSTIVMPLWRAEFIARATLATVCFKLASGDGCRARFLPRGIAQFPILHWVVQLPPTYLTGISFLPFR